MLGPGSRGRQRWRSTYHSWRTVLYQVPTSDTWGRTNEHSLVQCSLIGKPELLHRTRYPGIPCEEGMFAVNLVPLSDDVSISPFGGIKQAKPLAPSSVQQGSDYIFLYYSKSRKAKWVLVSNPRKTSLPISDGDRSKLTRWHQEEIHKTLQQSED